MPQQDVLVREHPVYYGRRLRFSGRMSDEGFQAWRASIPFTNEQIASALEAEAAAAPNNFLAQRYQFNANRVRNGYLNSVIVRLVLGRLVTTCEICGKKALYMRGINGRCSAHRDIANLNVEFRRQRMDAKSSQIETSNRTFAAYEKKHKSVLKARKWRRGSS